MATGTVRYESRDRIALITLDRPDKRNAISRTMAEELCAAWARFDAGDDAVAVLTGSGTESFSAGADIMTLENLSLENFRMLPGIGVELRKPLITAVSGWCVGLGLGFVIHSDLCVAAENARFWYREPRLGFGSGLFAGLAARIPQKIAFEFMLTANPVSAARAREVGMINSVVPVGQHVDAALEYARGLAALPPRVLSHTKSQLQAVIPKAPAETSAIVRLQQEWVLSTADRDAGVNAFREGRSSPFGSQ